MSELESKSLAELHELAGKAKIEGYRLLRREDLVEKLEGSEAGASGSGGESDTSGRSGSREERRPRRRRGRGGRDRGGRDRDRDRDDRGSGGDQSGRGGRDGGRDEEVDADAEELKEATGVLEVQARGSGLVRGEGLPDAGVYVSPAQIRRCELRSGDEVSGPVRPARRGERRPSLVRVEKVNGEPPVDERGPVFDGLTPVAPHRQIPLAAADDVIARAVDLVAPLAFGQRVLVEAQPRSGRTTVLKALSKAIAAGSDEAPEVTALLVDERPEEVTSWSRETEGVAIEAAPADLGAKEQVRVAERVLAKVRRQAESGKDVVLIVDSLTRLGTAYGEPGSVKPFFGTGRELEEEGAGSVTVIATVLEGSAADQAVLDAVRTTENSTVRLDSGLAAAGVVPCLDVRGCAISGQESILGESGVEALRKLRSELAGLEPVPAAERVAELVKGSADNRELLEKL
jgi:transcription termination factor Rho